MLESQFYQEWTVIFTWNWKTEKVSSFIQGSFQLAFAKVVVLVFHCGMVKLSSCLRLQPWPEKKIKILTIQTGWFESSPSKFLLSYLNSFWLCKINQSISMASCWLFQCLIRRCGQVHAVQLRGSQRQGCHHLQRSEHQHQRWRRAVPWGPQTFREVSLLCALTKGLRLKMLTGLVYDVFQSPPALCLMSSWRRRSPISWCWAGALATMVSRLSQNAGLG